jgi:alpha-N-arabinofuranosidase
MDTTTISLCTEFQVAPVDPRVFGGFLEHMGRAIYQGVYDPTSKHADRDGVRTDTVRALRRLRFTTMRYPGGNFASGYHWLDGVGPRAQRPTLRELAWQSLEPNQFGTDEFIELSRRMDWAPMLTVNLGTGTPEEARNWVEYCNSPRGSKHADLRTANGHAEPYGVKLWCLGNEMDGPWQLGHVPAGEYAVRAQQAAKMMNDVDKSVELVACGSCGIGMPTYMEWDRQVLEYLGDQADYISLHRYARNDNGNTADFLAISNSIDRQIEEMDAACRFVQARRRSVKRAYLCFDEWNVWYRNQQQDGEGQFAPHLIEETYNLEDALVVAGFLNSFIRHADMVKLANLAQIVNVIAPILTRGDELLLQSIYYPLEMYARRRQGTALQVAVDGPGYESPTYGPAHFVDASVILNGNRLHVFTVNRSVDQAAPVRVRLTDRVAEALEAAEVVSGPGAEVANSFERPDIVRAQPWNDAHVVDGAPHFCLPPLSVAATTWHLGDR